MEIADQEVDLDAIKKAIETVEPQEDIDWVDDLPSAKEVLDLIEDEVIPLHKSVEVIETPEDFHIDNADIEKATIVEVENANGQMVELIVIENPVMREVIDQTEPDSSPAPVGGDDVLPPAEEASTIGGDDVLKPVEEADTIGGDDVLPPVEEADVAPGSNDDVLPPVEDVDAAPFDSDPVVGPDTVEPVQEAEVLDETNTEELDVTEPEVVEPEVDTASSNAQINAYAQISTLEQKLMALF